MREQCRSSANCHRTFQTFISSQVLITVVYLYTTCTMLRHLALAGNRKQFFYFLVSFVSDLLLVWDSRFQYFSKILCHFWTSTMQTSTDITGMALVSSLCINAFGLSKYSMIQFLRLPRAGNNTIQDKVWLCEISIFSKLYNFTEIFSCTSPAFCY